MFSEFGPLRRAVRESDREVELIAASLVRDGVPLWSAIEEARRIYRERRAAEKARKTLEKLNGS